MGKALLPKMINNDGCLYIMCTYNIGCVYICEVEGLYLYIKCGGHNYCIGFCLLDCVLYVMKIMDVNST